LLLQQKYKPNIRLLQSTRHLQSCRRFKRKDTWTG